VRHSAGETSGLVCSLPVEFGQRERHDVVDGNCDDAVALAIDGVGTEAAVVSRRPRLRGRSPDEQEWRHRLAAEIDNGEGIRSGPGVTTLASAR
jgi:hypothetical protein